MPRVARPVVILALAMLVAACAQPGRETRDLTGLPAPEGFPAHDYAQAAAQGQPVYRVDPARSVVVVTVRRAGSLAHLGHDHVVASRGVQGYVAPDAGRADLFVPLNDLTVDEPALRAEAGFDTRPSDADIAGTRDNMHAKVLETRRFPFALIHIGGAEKTASGAKLEVAITLHGVQKKFVVPVMLEIGRGEVNASGSLEFNQSDFGIVPLSVLGGALQVQDRLGLRFAVRAIAPPQ